MPAEFHFNGTTEQAGLPRIAPEMEACSLKFVFKLN
jgi:hypothetical protein